jgi:PAS domain S-box-containing protein
MSKIKGPGLLIRISHLIFIQIIFVFTALGLVLFNTSDDSNLARQFQQQGQRIHAASAELAKTLDGIVLKTPDDTSRVLAARQFLINHGLKGEVDCLYHDSSGGADSLIYLATNGIENVHLADFSELQSGPLFHLLAASDKPFIALLSRDGKSISYLTRSTDAPAQDALIITVPNELSRSAKNNQAELLFILFLISALISLLIINLISRGIKRPLTNLIGAFEKTAGGEEHYIAEQAGDKDIQRLTDAFNKMSQSLAEKQRRLSAANKELLKANKSLIDSESILTALVDYSPEAIIVTDLDDQVIIYNQQAAQDLGYNQTEMLGKKIGNLLTVPQTPKKLDDTMVIHPEAQEIICRRRDGGHFPALLIHTALGPEGCSPIAMLYFIKNISESENYQKMILKLDRVASRGKMARDIAHEINNYLAVLQGNLELVTMILSQGDIPKIEKKINIMKDTVAKIVNFTDGLTQFSDENSEFRRTDLNQLVENLVAFLKPQNKFDEILIGTNLGDNLPLVEIDAAQIQLLLVNLIYNAAEALADFDGTRWIIISTSLDESGSYFYLKVADSGPGVDTENISKLFVGRFSTKQKANGLGLITCKNVVENHRGEVAYHTGDESKAIFVIKLPVKRFLEKTVPEPVVAVTN